MDRLFHLHATWDSYAVGMVGSLALDHAIDCVNLF
jgi:hypothetical protein